MDDTLNMLEDAVARVLAGRLSPRATLAAEAQGIDRETWRQLQLLGVAGPEAGTLEFATHAVVLRAVGYAGALVPYADSETLGRWLLQHAGLDSSDEIVAVAVLPSSAVRLDGTRATLGLRGRRVPWARHAQRVVFSAEVNGRSFVLAVPAAALTLRLGANLAGEPHDEVSREVVAEQVVEVSPQCGPQAVMARGALARVLQMQGAMARVNELTLQYAHDRKQFSRSLAQYQIVQSYLAAMAGELCATEAAAAAAILEAAGAGAGDAIAAAKLRAGQAAHVITAHGHQVHGAIGFTRECPLNLWTRRLWAWREEYGNETHWARLLGAAVVGRGADALWPGLTRTEGMPWENSL